ncbi:unnamed protein product [Rhizoctonia solani]|uniref:Ubiquitin-like-conjugating enzyme ATG10 n=1 Tax=Rhizoctonia solani TaxID=456999 RepID=A0A8H3A2D2_9AGAM|nr:unnamed protein product [Rhizoctonia solani]
MEPPATLSRDEFNRACQVFLREPLQRSGGENSLYVSFGTWTWTKHNSIPNWGYLARSSSSKAFKLGSGAQEVTLLEDHDELTEDDDGSCAPTNEDEAERVYFHESIVWHPTYMVPAYYFQAADASGSPVSVTRVINTARFRGRTFSDMADKATEYGIHPTRTADAQFPLLSNGDHPITGAPHWYFHPCETSAAVREILSQTLNISWDPRSDGCLLHWFKAWLAVLTTAIDLNK